MTDSRAARWVRRPWLRRVVVTAAARLLRKFGDPEGINPAALVGLGAFMYVATGSRSRAKSSERATPGCGAECSPVRSLCLAEP